MNDVESARNNIRLENQINSADLNFSDEEENSTNQDPIPNLPKQRKPKSQSTKVSGHTDFTSIPKYQTIDNIPLQRNSILKLEATPIFKLLPPPSLVDLVHPALSCLSSGQFGQSYNGMASPGSRSFTSFSSLGQTSVSQFSVNSPFLLPRNSPNYPNISYYDNTEASEGTKSSKLYNNLPILSNTLSVSMESLKLTDVNPSLKITCTICLWDINTRQRLSEEFFFNGKTTTTALVPIRKYSDGLFFIIRVSSQFLPVTINNAPDMLMSNTKLHENKFVSSFNIIKQHNLAPLKMPIAWGAIPLSAVMQIQSDINKNQSQIIENLKMRDNNSVSSDFSSCDLALGENNVFSPGAPSFGSQTLALGTPSPKINQLSQTSAKYSTRSMVRSTSQNIAPTSSPSIQNNVCPPTPNSSYIESSTKHSNNSTSSGLSSKHLIRSSSFRSSIKSFGHSTKVSLGHTSSNHGNNNDSSYLTSTGANNHQNRSPKIDHHNGIYHQSNLDQFYEGLKKGAISFKVHNLYKYESVSKLSDSQICKYCSEFYKTENLLIPEKLKKQKIDCHIDLKFAVYFGDVASNLSNESSPEKKSQAGANASSVGASPVGSTSNIELTKSVNSMSSSSASFTSTPNGPNPNNVKKLIDFQSTPLNHQIHENYNNFLYIYPTTLSLSSQKSKNLVLHMYLLSGENWKNDVMENLFSENGRPTEHLCSNVCYHEKIVNFNHEWKVRLPFSLTEDHYLLFYVYNIDGKMFESIESSKGSSKLSNLGKGNLANSKTPNLSKVSGTNETNTTNTKYDPYQRIGFTWLPLLDDRNVLINGNFSLPIASHNSDVKSGFSSLPPSTKTSEYSWLKNAHIDLAVKAVSSVHSNESQSLDRLFQLYSAIKFCKDKYDKHDKDSQINHSLKVFGTRLTSKMLLSEYSSCLNSLIKNIPNMSKDQSFKFFPQVLNILLEAVLNDQFNNTTAFEALVHFIDSLVEYKLPNNKDDFQRLALDSVGLNRMCGYVDGKFNPLMFYSDIFLGKKQQLLQQQQEKQQQLQQMSENSTSPTNSESTSALPMAKSQSTSSSSLTDLHPIKKIQYNKSDMDLNRSKSGQTYGNVHNSSRQNGNGNMSHNNNFGLRPQSASFTTDQANLSRHTNHKSQKIVTTIHYELAHFWKMSTPELRQKIHNSSLFYFKIIIKSLAISVQLDKRTLKPAADKEFRKSMFKIVEYIIEDMKVNVKGNPINVKRLAYSFSYFIFWGWKRKKESHH